MCELGESIRDALKSIRPAAAVATKPELEWHKLSGSTLKGELVDDLGLEMMYPVMLDGNRDYWFTSDADFYRALLYILKVFELPVYQHARFDCEDFAMLVKGLLSAFFGYNSVAFIIGPGHAWLWVRTTTGWHQLEPQKLRAGTFPTDAGRDGYSASHVLA